MKISPVIKLNNVSKRYNSEYVLKDINFDLGSGESLGIIGKNGAGKSTLLKILAGITKPSSGEVQITGLVTSIIDVGTGFHPDLTGRENIYMASSLLGFSKRKVSGLVDDIIEFSELAGHIDQPVKNYSNGMYLRLAFSIYVFLNTDILIIDEVLSVGDASFKKKITSIIHEFRNQGKTLVIVSHNLNDILNFCDRVIYLDKNIKADSTNLREVTNLYIMDNQTKLYSNDLNAVIPENLKSMASVSKFPTIENETFKLINLEFITNNEHRNQFLQSEKIEIRFTYYKKRWEGTIELGIKFFDSVGNMLLIDSFAFSEYYRIQDSPLGMKSVSVFIPPNFFNQGDFSITLMQSECKVSKGTWHNIGSFKIIHDGWIKNEKWAQDPSPLMPHFEWKWNDVNGKSQ